MIFRSCGDDRFNNSSFDQVETIEGTFSSTYALLDASKPRPRYAAYPKKPAPRRIRTRNRLPIIERNLFNVHLADRSACRAAFSLGLCLSKRTPGKQMGGKSNTMDLEYGLYRPSRMTALGQSTRNEIAFSVQARLKGTSATEETSCIAAHTLESAKAMAGNVYYFVGNSCARRASRLAFMTQTRRGSARPHACAARCSGVHCPKASLSIDQPGYSPAVKPGKSVLRHGRAKAEVAGGPSWTATSDDIR